MKVKIVLIVMVLLATCLVPGCIGVPQEEYDAIKIDLAEAQAQLAISQTNLGREQARVKEVEAQAVAYQEQIAGLEGQLDFYQSELSNVESQLQTYQGQVAELERQLEISQSQVPIYKLPSERTFTDCIEPMDTVVRNKAATVVADAPSGIYTDSTEWKIWKINYWVANNISGVTDPKGHEYFAYAHETLETKAGDCDDFAILLASMYEAVGLDASVVLLDTDDTEGADHMACLVYYLGDSNSFLDKEQTILSKLGLQSSTGHIEIRFWGVDSSHAVLGKYESGIWIIADPPMAEVRDLVGYVTHAPYKGIEITDVGD